MTNLPLPIEPSHPIFLALAEIQKPRTKFQLEKFVVGQHDTPQQQYKQTLLEIQNLIYNIKAATLELKKTQIIVDRLRATGDEVDAIEADIKDLGAEQTRLALIGAHRELNDLVGIWETFETKYTQEDIEQDQPVYWQARLERQSILESIGGSQAQAAHLESLRQIGAVSLDKNTDTELEVKEKKELL